MMMPTHCPCCHDPLLNEFLPTTSGSEFIRKICQTRVGHRFSCITYQDNNAVDLVALDLPCKVASVTVLWDFRKQRILVTKSSFRSIESTQPLPFFQPDFSDYKKLIEKLQTYITFS